MANELRVRTNFVGGLIEDNPLASGATVLTSAGLASLPAIGATQHLPIVLDPDGRAGNPEIAYVTAHTASAATATITKGQEGTTARAHDRDTPWLHGPTTRDFEPAPAKVVATNSGDLTLSSANTNWTAINGSTWDAVIAAAVGDNIDVNMGFRGSGGNFTFFDVMTIVGGSPVNCVSGNAYGLSTGAGLGAMCAPNGFSGGVQGQAIYTVVAGDIVGGLVTFRPMFRNNTSGTAFSIFVSTPAGSFHFNVRNLGA